MDEHVLDDGKLGWDSGAEAKDAIGGRHDE